MGVSAIFAVIVMVEELIRRREEDAVESCRVVYVNAWKWGGWWTSVSSLHRQKEETGPGWGRHKNARD